MSLADARRRLAREPVFHVVQAGADAVRILLAVLALAVGGTLSAALVDAQAPRPQLPIFGYQIVHTYPHDPKAFTQGLEYADGFFYEGTGLNGRSSIRKVAVATGAVVQQRAVAEAYFGEGITLWHSALVELTWQSHVALVYDRRTFAPQRTFHYAGEGWGLTHDATHLIMSDGTDQLRVLEPSTFAEQRRIAVTAVGLPLRNLNELEYTNGEILANVWMTDYVARIAPGTGRVTGYVDLRGLLPESERGAADVLNGIAYDREHDRLFVTGKLWPRVYEIRITAPRGT